MKKWEPTQSDIDWMKNVIGMLKEAGGSWTAPAYTMSITFDKVGMLFHIDNKGSCPDTLTLMRTRTILKKLGWKETREKIEIPIEGPPNIGYF